MVKGFFAILAVTCSISASPITYTLTGALSGTLNGTAFSNAQVAVMLTGDTAGVVEDLGLLINPASSATFSITGFGSGEFTENVIAFANPVQFQDWAYAGVLPADRRQNTGITLRDAAFIGWDLVSSLGPVSALVNFTGGQFATTLGTLDLPADNLGHHPIAVSGWFR